MRILGALLPSFLLAMLYAAFGVWMATHDYGVLSESKKAGSTGYVLFLGLLLCALGAFAPRFAFIRSFVFRSRASPDAVCQGSRSIVLYSAILVVLHFCVR